MTQEFAELQDVKVEDPKKGALRMRGETLLLPTLKLGAAVIFSDHQI